jgi:hypothetical protein
MKSAPLLISYVYLKYPNYVSLCVEKAFAFRKGFFIATLLTTRQFPAVAGGFCLWRTKREQFQ